MLLRPFLFILVCCLGLGGIQICLFPSEATMGTEAGTAVLRKKEWVPCEHEVIHDATKTSKERQQMQRRE